MTTEMTTFDPRSIEEATALSKTLAQSALIPEALRKKPEDVFVTILTGRELGLSPMQSLRGMYVVNGKAVMSADLMVALVLSHRDVCDHFDLIESTDKIATYEAQRVGRQPVRMGFSIEQASLAGLSGKGTWKAYPAAMLRARAAAALARAVFPDLVAGVYESGEGEEIRSGKMPSAPSAFTAPKSPASPASQASPSEVTLKSEIVEGELVSSSEIGVAEQLMIALEEASSAKSQEALAAAAVHIKEAFAKGEISKEEKESLGAAYLAAKKEIAG
jgi:hypothetical protein